MIPAAILTLKSNGEGGNLPRFFCFLGVIVYFVIW